MSIIQTYSILNNYNRNYEHRSEIIYSEFDFSLRYHSFGEIRMGLEACGLEIKKNDKTVPLKHDFLATIPTNYEPFSADGKHALIPTCPIYKEPSPILMNTTSLERRRLTEIKGSILSNEFSKHEETQLLVLTTSNIFFFDVKTSEHTVLDYKYEWPDFPIAYFSNANTVFIIENKSKESSQNIIALDLTKNAIIEKKLISNPEIVFNIDLKNLQKRINDDRYRLFRNGSATVGYLLNKWTFKVENNGDLIATTLIPKSNVYRSERWETEGVDVEEKAVKFTFSWEQNGSQQML